MTFDYIFRSVSLLQITVALLMIYERETKGINWVYTQALNFFAESIKCFPTHHSLSISDIESVFGTIKTIDRMLYVCGSEW